MNVVLLSPHFPPNYYQFAARLRGLGVNVLGLADEPYDRLRQELKSALTEYYYVNDMHRYDELLRALGYFTYRYGKIDQIDSFNEYWLETEAQLRTDFNIDGIQSDEIQRIKRKSLMKEVFRKANVPVAPGRLVRSLSDARRLLKQIGYPVVAKPDVGVGAAKTYKIHSPEELESFFAQKPPVDYMMEAFIDGEIITFDGLTDRDGVPVFFSSLQYSQGVMEAVNNDDDIFYYTLRVIPPDLEAMGRKLLRAFNVRARFFHFEFFRKREDGSLLALEVNMRPPGGLTTDMFNYANDIDIYQEWANIVVNNCFQTEYTRPYHCCYVGRKNTKRYAHSHDEIIQALGPCCISHHEPISGVFSRALGDYGYLVRSPDLDSIFAMANFIQRRA